MSGAMPQPRSLQCSSMQSSRSPGVGARAGGPECPGRRTHPARMIRARRPDHVCATKPTPVGDDGALARPEAGSVSNHALERLDLDCLEKHLLGASKNVRVDDRHAILALDQEVRIADLQEFLE